VRVDASLGSPRVPGPAVFAVPEEIGSALRGFGVAVTDASQATNHSESFNKVKSSTRSADAVWRFVDAQGKSELGVIVEVQLAVDEDKLFSWPVYVAGLRADLECAACVIVATPSRNVAEWASQPIVIGPGNVFRPIVLGPEQLPLITDEGEASRALAVAVLGVLAHARSRPEEAARAALATAKACLGVSNRLFVWCYDVFCEALSGAALAILEKLMELDVRNLKSEFSRRHVAFGEAEAVLEVLEARGLPVTADQRERIRSCADFDMLKGWLRKAVTATSTDELFA
jgi:hypothetical protein